VGSNLVSSKILDGSGAKAMPGLNSAPNSGSLLKNKKNTSSQMGHTKKKIFLMTGLCGNQQKKLVTIRPPAPNTY
jgi:hypothetical protein